MKFKQRAVALVAAAALGLSLVGCQSLTPEQEPEAFDQFVQNDFIADMTSNYWSLTQFLEHPETYDIDKKEVDADAESSFGWLRTGENLNASLLGTRQFRQQLSQFHLENLTAEQQDTYALFDYLLTLNEKSSQSKFQYLPSFFEAGNHILYSINTVLSELSLRDEDDIEKLWELMDTIPDYMDQVLDYTRQQQEKGLLMVSFDDILEYCQTCIDAGTNSGTLQSLKNNIASVGLDADKTAQYQQQAEESYRTNILPIFQTSMDTLNELKGGKNNTQGLCYLPNGKEYYENLFAAKTGSQRSISETTALLEKLVEESTSQLTNLLLKNPELAESLSNFKTNFTDYNSIIDYLTQASQKDFSTLKPYTYEAKTLSADQNMNNIVAYYLFPALDNTKDNRIRVNPNLDISELQMYQTLAHEGVPGHMYQTNYKMQHAINPWRSTINLLGFTEGYAMYSELMALQYLPNASEDMITAFQLATILDYAAPTMLDINIHYNGWTVQDLMTYYQNRGRIVDEETAQMMYTQLQATPGIYLSYGVGLLEVLNLRSSAEEQLGDQFDAKAFHEALLKAGNVPFFLIEKNVNAYIDATLHPAADTTSALPSAA